MVLRRRIQKYTHSGKLEKLKQSFHKLKLIQQYTHSCQRKHTTQANVRGFRCPLSVTKYFLDNINAPIVKTSRQHLIHLSTHSNKLRHCTPFE